METRKREHKRVVDISQARIMNDIGLENDDINFDYFDIAGEDDNSRDRYIRPKLTLRRSCYVRYEHALDLAADLKLDKGERADVLISGNFIFGDFIEAYLQTYNVKCLEMTISTLSLSQNNVDSLHNLITHGYIDKLNLIVSTYFYSHEFHALIPYIQEKLDICDKFQLAIADVHTKTCQFQTLGGRYIVMHGSANLRSSGNIEQITLEENQELYDFYKESYDQIVNTYNTINKAVRNPTVWEGLEKHIEPSNY